MDERRANASYALLLARTDPEAEKHAGLTAFAIDMHAPGVEVRPLRQMNGGADFSEVFIADVRIPDSERLGDVGSGWAVSHHTLVQERYNMPRIPNRGEGQISAVVRAWEQRADKTSATARALKDRLMQHWIEAEVLRLLQAARRRTARRGWERARGFARQAQHLGRRPSAGRVRAVAARPRRTVDRRLRERRLDDATRREPRGAPP